jgi:4-alpha-glucanotransferase
VATRAGYKARVTDLSPELAALAAAYGVASEYWDWRGRHVPQPAETVVAVLRALGVDAATPEAAAAALLARERERWSRLLPPCVVTRQGRPVGFAVHVDDGAPVEVWLELETGGSRAVSQVDNWEPAREYGGRRVGEASFVAPDDLPLGYHRLLARSGGAQVSSTLIVTPGRLGLPERVGERRVWGVATQLYSVRSERSWGVGDLADLADLAAWTARQGGGFVLVNPMHAAQPVPPLEPSPYLPASRRFGNPLYLRVEAVPEYAYLDPAGQQEAQAARAKLAARLTGTDRIDRDAAWAAKLPALRRVYAVPRSAGRELAYQAYREQEGAGLVDFATWGALAQAYGPDWRAWPEPLRHPGNPEVAAFRDGHAAEVDFQCWLQWVLAEQLDGVQAAARRNGAVLGVLHDLAVGVHHSGADSWALQDVLASGVQVGAPPDAFNQLGQNWQQPPWRPDRLAELAYAPFRDMVRALVRHAGGVRVDHVIGLFRLWWIPAGNLPDAGTYVAYDHEAMIGILALEAHRAGALVVGEDLGVVEPSTRAYLRERGILGTSILWFEEDYEGDGRPLSPQRWREYCLAAVTTHDLPPTAGYLAGEHIRLRDSLGLLTRPLAEELAADAESRQAWLAELRSRGLLASGAGEEETVAALHRFLTLTPCRLLAVALTDAVGDRRTQNQPGTLEEYPNWRIPLSGPGGEPILLEDVLRSPRAADLAAVLTDGLAGRT